MKKGETIDYEWWVWEGCDGPHDRSGDFFWYKTYAEAHRDCNYSEGMFIELTRAHWCEDNGLLDRDYATVKDGRLPECYDTSSQTLAKKLHAEVRAAHAEAFFKP
jgi:hypothetical protein